MRCPNAGIALVCGREAGLEVLDVDPRHGGIDPQLSAVACSTPRGGLHYHFTRPDAIPSLESAGLEWLGDGHIARVPPTPGYKWLNRGLPKLRQDSAQWVLPEFLSPKRPSRPQRSLHQHKTCDRDLKRSLGDCVGGLRQRPEQIGASLDTKAQREFQRLLEQLGVQFDRGCHRQVVICPWHDDHDPSLSLDLERCLFKCFSPRCGVHGGIGTLRKLAGETPPFVGSISSCRQKGVSEQDRLISALRDAGEDDATEAVNSCHREFRVYRCQACGKTPAYPVSWGFPLCPCASEPGLVSWSAPDVAR
jgi:hypothetical protein